MVPSLLLSLALVARAEPARGVVVVPLEAIREAPPQPPERPPNPVVIDQVDVTVDAADESRVRLTCGFTLWESAWVDLPVAHASVAVRSARLDGRPARLVRVGDGTRRLVAELPPGRHVVEVDGTVDTQAAALELATPAAARSRVRTRGAGLDFTVQGGVRVDDDAWVLAPAAVTRGRVGSEPVQDRVRVGWVPERPDPPRPRVVTVESAVGLRAEEGGVEGRARLRYRVVDGTIDRLRVRVPGGVEQVEASGRGVVGHRVQGDVVEVQLREAVEGRVVVDLRWRGAAPGQAAGTAPVPVPLDGRGEGYVTVTRGDDSLLVPTPRKALEPVAVSALPGWARGLVPGRPLVSYRSDAAERAELDWQRLSWSPVDAPPTLVDEARYTVVHAEHGRVHVRADWQVRNDRNPFLGVRLPPGWEAVGLRVAGRTAEPARGEDGRLLLPLEKSVETLDGLVAFPVELMLVGDEVAWSRRGERALATPAVDAPVAYARWEVRLPSGVEERKVEGVPTVVERWTPRDESVVIGRATGTTLADEDRDDVDGVVLLSGVATSGRKRSKRGKKGKAGAVGGKRANAADDGKAVSQEYWNRAYSAYKDNRFDEAEVLLEKSLEYDQSNANASSLLQNVDVLQGDVSVSADQQAQANRVRELARARTGDLELEQARRERALEEKVRAGDAAAAREEAEALLRLTEQLAAVEQSEAVEQKSRLDSYRSQLAELDGRDDSGVVVDNNEIADAAGVLGVVGGVAGGEVFGELRGAKGGEGQVGGLGLRGSGVGGGGTAAGLGAASPKKKKKPAQKSDKRTRAPASSSTSGADSIVIEGRMSKPEVKVAERDEIDFEGLEISGELVKPQGQLLLDRKKSEAAPFLPSGSEAVAVDDGMGAGFATLVEEEPMPEPEAEAVAAGSYGDSFDFYADEPLAPTASPAPPPPPPREPAPPEEIEEYDLDGDVVDSADRSRVLTKEHLSRVPAGRSYQAAVQVQSESVERRRRLRIRWPDLSRAKKPPPPEPETFPTGARPDEAFPEDGPSPARFPTYYRLNPPPPVDAGPPPVPVAPQAPAAFPFVGAPVGHDSVPLAPRPGPAFPQKPPPPPAASFGLDVPGGITASTLSLSLPETEAGLLLEQRLLAPGEPLTLSLRYRARPRK